MNWRNTIAAVITCDTRYGDEGNLKRQIKNPTVSVELSSRKNDLHNQIIPTKLHFSLY